MVVELAEGTYMFQEYKYQKIFNKDEDRECDLNDSNLK
jgi:hypothetical protein